MQINDDTKSRIQELVWLNSRNPPFKCGYQPDNQVACSTAPSEHVITNKSIYIQKYTHKNNPHKNKLHMTTCNNKRILAIHTEHHEQILGKSINIRICMYAWFLMLFQTYWMICNGVLPGSFYLPWITDAIAIRFWCYSKRAEWSVTVFFRVLSICHELPMPLRYHIGK